MLRLVANCSKIINSRLFNTSSYVQAVRQLDTTTTTSLSNGVRIITQPNEELNSSIGIFFDVGAVNEDPKINGINNFIANTAFRGTLKQDRNAIKKEVESMGAVLDAYSAREMSGYVINCSSSDVVKSLEILGDIVLNAKFEDFDVEEARRDILSQLETLETCYGTVVMDFLHSTAFQGTLLGQSVYGPSDVIKNLDRHSLREYVKNNYKATRMVVVTFGGQFDPKDIVKKSETLFGNMDSTYSHSVPDLNVHYRYTGSDMKLRDDDMEMAHVAVGVQGPAYRSPDRIVLDVANSITGAWTSGECAGGSNVASPLVRRILESNLGVSVQPFNHCYNTTGLWGSYVVGPRMTIYDLVKSVQQEWMRQANSVSQFEVDRAKTSLRTRLLQRMLDPMLHVGDMARDVFYCGRVVPAHEVDSVISGVTSSMVKDAVYKYVYDQCPVLAAIGPTETIPNYNNLRSNMYWFRM